MIKNIFFDLDNTLVPMDEMKFVQTYFYYLTKLLLPLGYQKEDIESAIWKGTQAMIMNNGEKRNEEVFWETFKNILGDDILNHKDVIDEFYEKEFINLKVAIGYEPKAKELIDLLSKRFNLLLTTNPLFPISATKQRAEWGGCPVNLFSYVTSYENSSFCKPNPLYYKEILEKNNLKAEETLMVGNDLTEDGIASTLGIKTFIVTDHLINRKNKDINEFPHGTFNDLINFINSL